MANWFDKAPKEHLAGKTAIVVGGSSGIGEGAAHTLAAAGANVVVSGVPAEGCEKVAADIVAEGGVAIGIFCDATSQESIDNLFSTAKETYGSVDIMVTTCGIALPRQDVLTLEREKWDKILLLNVTANFLLTQTAGRYMKDNEDGGRIVIVSSARGLARVKNAGPYGITKAAVMGMVRSFCIDFAEYGITVNGLAPGYVFTPMVAKVFDELPQQRDFVMSRTPLKNLGSIDDMAATILYLCLPQAEYTSGQTFIVDGGWYCNA